MLSISCAIWRIMAMRDFRPFMKEVVYLTYDEAKRKLLKTYGTPERIQMKTVKDVEVALHSQIVRGSRGAVRDGRC